MTDLEITKLCAEAMGYAATKHLSLENVIYAIDYEPLENDAQAMALVKKFNLNISRIRPNIEWGVEKWGIEYLEQSTYSKDLNRAICECCAKMWLSRKEEKNGDATNKDKDR